jgi:hypothetical protein
MSKKVLVNGEDMDIDFYPLWEELGIAADDGNPLGTLEIKFPDGRVITISDSLPLM